MRNIFLILILFFGFINNTFGKDIISSNIITPVEFFKSGQVSYYYGYDGLLEFKLDNKTYTHKNIIEFDNKPYGKPSFNKLTNNIKEVYYLSDGSISLHRMEDDYSCNDFANNNCLYAPLYIRKIFKKSLIGNMSLYRVDNNIPLEEKDIINFSNGSMLYSIVVDVPAFDFSTFNDFDSLVCMRNEENLCKGVINNGRLDKLALFELNRIYEDNKEFLYKDVGDGLIYGIDLYENTITPYNKACFKAATNIDDLEGCIEPNLKKGYIKQSIHPNGLIYWEMYFQNISIDNIIYWVNNRGEPFKAYTNNHYTYNFSIFNKISSDLIKKVFSANTTSIDK